jgi:glyoxylase-like metal-dependent hydrolase (beta-lactamase superfamily II)
MTEVFPGIRWVQLPITLEQSDLEYVNVYLVAGDKGYLLVDSGWNTDESFATLHNALVKNGIAFNNIKQILVTHVHPDHYGMAGRIRELSGATLMMHHIEKEFIVPRYVKMESLLAQTDRLLVTNGVPEAETVNLRDATLGLENYIIPAQPDRTLHDGETINIGTFTFRVIWTPGHSSGHICLYEPEKKVLLSGDHILPQITPNVSVHPQSIENPLGRYLQSLKEISKLDVTLTLPGHYKPFTNLKERINEIMLHHGIRNQEILEAIGETRKTAYQIAREITWGNNGGWEDLPPFHKRMAVFETLAHLEMLAADDLLNRLPGRGIIAYSVK